MEKLFQAKHWRSIIALTVVMLSACRPSLCPEAKHIDDDYRGPCVAKVERQEGARQITVSPHPLCPWPRLVDLGIFKGFKPGMTFEEARQVLGPPDAEVERGGERLWRYQQPYATVQIGHEDQGSGIIPFYYWWTLRAFPKDPSLEAFFNIEVVVRLPRNQDPYEVFVLNQCGLTMVGVTIEMGKIKSVEWTRNPGSYDNPSS